MCVFMYMCVYVRMYVCICLYMYEYLFNNDLIILGGPTPLLPMEKWGKSIWKEREMNTFPSLSIYFFPIFPHGKKWEHTFFYGQKWGWTPPPPFLCLFILLNFGHWSH